MTMNRNTIVEFVSSLSDEDLRFLNSRLTERLQGDIAEALDFISHFKAMDAICSAATSSDEVYNICDQIAEFLQKECKKKGIKQDRR
jgi:hypothetical protein